MNEKKVVLQITVPPLEMKYKSIDGGEKDKKFVELFQKGFHQWFDNALNEYAEYVQDHMQGDPKRTYIALKIPDFEVDFETPEDHEVSRMLVDQIAANVIKSNEEFNKILTARAVKHIHVILKAYKEKKQKEEAQAEEQIASLVDANISFNDLLDKLKE